MGRRMGWGMGGMGWVRWLVRTQRHTTTAPTRSATRTGALTLRPSLSVLSCRGVPFGWGWGWYDDLHLLSLPPVLR